MVDEARKPYTHYMDELTIGDKVYISSKQAAKITGYAKDYVGQLCREGRVEARLVGRNWYVLEASIREHRFGKEAEEKVEAPAETPVDRVSTWQPPQYAPEVPPAMPELAAKSLEARTNPAIADMQSAWKEWFEEKKPSVTEFPEAVEESTEDETPVIAEEEPTETPVEIQEIEEVAISRVPEPVVESLPEPEESEVELHRSYASRERGEYVPTASPSFVDLSRVVREERREVRMPAPRKERARASITSQAVFVVIAIVAALVAIVGTGNADKLLSGTSFDFGAQKSIVDYLGGTRTYESSL